MQNLFSPDSKIMQAISRIGDLMLLNILYLVSCIPIITIGAASTAMYTVCFRLGTEQEQGLFRSFFQAFRDEFRQSTLLWLVLLLFGVSAYLNIVVFYRMSEPLHYAFLLFCVLFVLVLLIAAYLFPLLSQFKNNSRSTFQNALFLSIGYLPRSLLIVAINIFPFALLFLDLYLFFQIGFLWISLYFAAAAYINALLLKKVFAPYLLNEEEFK